MVHLDAIDESWDVGEAIRATSADTEDHTHQREEDGAIVHRALNLLGSRRNDAYEAALTELREGTQEWWADLLRHRHGANRVANKSGDPAEP